MFVANFFTWYLFGLETTAAHIFGLIIVFFSLLRYNQEKIQQFRHSNKPAGYEMEKLTTVRDAYIDTDSENPSDSSS